MLVCISFIVKLLQIENTTKAAFAPMPAGAWQRSTVAGAMRGPGEVRIHPESPQQRAPPAQTGHREPIGDHGKVVDCYRAGPRNLKSN